MYSLLDSQPNYLVGVGCVIQRRLHYFQILEHHCMTLARAFHRIEESVTDVRRLGDCYFVGMNLEMVSSHQKKQKEREDENDKISVTFFIKM